MKQFKVITFKCDVKQAKIIIKLLTKSYKQIGLGPYGFDDYSDGNMVTLKAYVDINKIDEFQNYINEKELTKYVQTI